MKYVEKFAIAFGIALCGLFIYLGISKYSEKDRCVEVKGLSEREVLANKVTWPMMVQQKGDDLEQIYKNLSEKKDAVLSFLKENKITGKEILVSSVSVSDSWEDANNAKNKKSPRYTVSLDITVTSNQVQHVIDIMNKQTDLLKKGISLEYEDYQVQYDYVDLSKLKPSMVEEATKDARNVAEKFAKDADCELGSIISASQGQFSVDDEYYKPQYKKIRVVTQISYYLK